MFELKKYNITLITSISNKLKAKLHNSIYPIFVEYLQYVYNFSYYNRQRKVDDVGMTTRIFKDSLIENIADIKLNRCRTVIAKLN